MFLVLLQNYLYLTNLLLLHTTAFPHNLQNTLIDGNIVSENLKFQ